MPNGFDPRSEGRLQQALQFPEHGLLVFPVHTPQGDECSCPDGAKCSRAGKHPRTKNGLNDASKDEDQVEEVVEKIDQRQHRNPNRFGVGDFCRRRRRRGGQGDLVRLGGGARQAAEDSYRQDWQGAALLLPSRGHANWYPSWTPWQDAFDIRGDGGYVIAPGSAGASGSTFRVPQRTRTG